MRTTSFSLFGLNLVLLISSTVAKTTTVGVETETESRGVSVPMDDCFDIDVDELTYPSRDVTTLAITKKCRVFTGPMCTGRTTLLEPGEHSSPEPVMLGSILCEEPEVFSTEL
ncbi:uncharacterized protein ANIA_00230 [Aspergillus nidulans FGSC A4]|uniref:Uncharacterized protein n=1 Tax=Emericella nidulans (strain FGSC A4 / ATCC 38163 / CBS 112.46 / NRRL 194 / M139) TaxID=227321 RepID=C8VUM6_EMENI|nr:hypothetical protein [Aspergillus nidulans FGSC A4]CBF89921.1 TPA: conserved hypothetical protein [Aspergillus nidulans FGSC A4]